MKTKTEAAKILLEVGWNWDEAKEVLEDELNDIDYVLWSEYPANFGSIYTITCDVGKKNSDGHTVYSIIDEDGKLAGFRLT